jgi:tetratricopeptide (TPR) repeat protein
MNPKTAHLFLAALAVILMATGPASTAFAETDDTSRAKSLYADARYTEALPLLLEIERAGRATGPLLYRLAYCQRATGDATTGSATEQRALVALERELDGWSDLEIPFYLCNVYQNTGREGDARRVAAEATARLESGAVALPESGPDMFRLGKLYADQGQEQKASEWYGRAVDRLTEDGRPGGSYVRRASRYVAERAFRAGQFERAQRYLTHLVEAGGAAPPDLDRLAVASARIGKYDEATAAWQQAILADPAGRNKARYALALVSMAARLKARPAEMPSGKAWTEATKEELEALMKEESDRVRQIQAEVAEAGQLEKGARKAHRARVHEARERFTLAALEYTLRGYGIRETAFFGGYAPLILNRSAWALPRPAQTPEQSEE